MLLDSLRPFIGVIFVRPRVVAVACLRCLAKIKPTPDLKPADGKDFVVWIEQLGRKPRRR